MRERGEVEDRKEKSKRKDKRRREDGEKEGREEREEIGGEERGGGERIWKREEEIVKPQWEPLALSSSSSSFSRHANDSQRPREGSTEGSCTKMVKGER